MPSQFENALRALKNKNTKQFNTRYSKEGVASRPKTPPSQFQAALRAYRSRSSTLFNSQYQNQHSPTAVGGLSSPRSPKTPRRTRSRAKKVRRGAMTYKNAEKIRIALGKPPLHPMTRRQYNPMHGPRRVLYMNNNNVKKEFNRLQSLPRFD